MKDQGVGCLLMLVLIVVLLTIGALFVTSTAILYHEEQLQTGAFKCHYFTGTRTITNDSHSMTGCKRFISVGGVTDP
jgi:hypothetical protein